MASNIALSRRQFLRGKLGSMNTHALRPPWAVDEQRFQGLCTRCDDCLRACEIAILVRGSGGFPEVDFRRGACTFCRLCVDACGPGALNGADKAPASAWRLGVSISDLCLSKRGVICRACGEVCESRAIRFQPLVGGRTDLVLDALRCNGCGACVSVCPEGVVSLEPLAETKD